MSRLISNVIKYYRGPPVCGKCKIFSKNLSCMLSNPMMTCGTNFLNTLYYLDSEKQTQWSDSADTQADLYLYWSHMPWAGFVKIRLIHKAEHNVPDEWNANVLMRKGLKILTHISLAFLFFWDIGKQCRPRSDAAERGIWSGSSLFANRNIYSK